MQYDCYCDHNFNNNNDAFSLKIWRTSFVDLVCWGWVEIFKYYFMSSLYNVYNFIVISIKKFVRGYKKGSSFFAHSCICRNGKKKTSFFSNLHFSYYLFSIKKFVIGFSNTFMSSLTTSTSTTWRDRDLNQEICKRL